MGKLYCANPICYKVERTITNIQFEQITITGLAVIPPLITDNLIKSRATKELKSRFEINRLKSCDGKDCTAVWEPPVTSTQRISKHIDQKVDEAILNDWVKLDLQIQFDVEFDIVTTSRMGFCYQISV